MTRNRPMREAALFLPLLALLLAAPTAAQLPDVPRVYSELELREIGPAVVGGRIHDVEALPHDPSTIYVASASGGLWKSTNKGTTWRPIFDDQATSTFGDIAISRSNPDVVWAGTGEQNNRQSTSWGSGVYRSTDAGETWTHLGLTETRHIGRVIVHPTDPDRAWVAAQGNLWRASPERGVYRTTDGGRTWSKTLFVDEHTGATDLIMDACDPNTLIAATYQRLRRTWGFNGGGPGSGVWKSTDGGETWRRMENGLPAGDKGRIGLAAAGNQCGIYNAIIEHDGRSGVYRTEDGGATWRFMSDRNIRPMYYSHIFIDPTNSSRVYTLATYSAVSEDGGRTWRDISGRYTYDVGVHSDHHTLWIDPRNPEHYYLAGDGGLHETWDMGESYVRMNQLPISQIYGMGVDMRDPYYVYLGLQDNHSWMGPNETRHWAGIIGDDWRQIGFGDGMYMQPDPTTHRYVYTNDQNGGYERLDAETGDRMMIAPIEPEGENYRWDWVSPSLLSAHDPSTLYVGGNRLFISRDRGSSWERTPDLTKQTDRDTLTLMGVPGGEIGISRNDGTSSYGEIVTIAESPLDPQVLWVGVDDGNLQVSRDGGDSWTEVSGNVPGLPAGTYVSRVIASRRGAPIAYATFDAHRDGDFSPYVYGTDDWGRTWTRLTEGLAGAGSANVIREHPDNPSTLFLGTEHGIWVSTDSGARWDRLGANFPVTLVDDMVIHPRDKDLVVGTHGRGVWILDDVAPLAAVADATGARVFDPPIGTIFQYWKDTSYRADQFWTGDNPEGTPITFILDSTAPSARLEIRRGDMLVRTFPVSGEAGVMQRVWWDLRHDLPEGLRDDDEPRDPRLAREVRDRGPLVSPGSYTVTLVAGGQRASADMVVRGDPRMPLTDDQYRARETFLLEIVRLRDRIRVARDEDAQNRAELGRLDRRLNGLFGDLEAGGVRSGTLYPPTKQQREELERVKARAEALIGG